GCTEVQLLGQNVNSYRDPSPAGWDFATLLSRVGEIPGMQRVRFTTSHPRDFVKPIIDAIEERPTLCNHVHLPVQSGSSNMLQRMQRLYTRDEYMRRIEWMKNSRRNIAITTDIIVGFPGETEPDFQKTLDLLDEVEYDSLFAFKYSPRPNTAALAMEDAVPEEEKTRRIMILLERQRAIQIRRNSELIGTVEEVHVEGQHESLGQWIGRTSQNRTLNFVHPDAGGASLIGRYLPVRVTRAGPNSLVGEALTSVV
ncbi:MAG: MiaB/RimO family radical SAM methylthiotransferase, partial [Bryobacteraceae bacterium]